MKRFIQTPTMLAIRNQDLPCRVIFMDGRAPEADPNPSWMGYSVGRWDGDTLVIDTVNLTDRTRLDDHGNVHSDALHVVERYRRINKDTMEVEATIEDPEFYTKPWTVYQNIAWRPGQELLEYICQENNRDLQHLVGQ